MSDQSPPLTGITVIDLTRVLSGPYCTMQLADMGARVIKIEHPVHGDDTRAWGPPFLEGESTYYLSVNRNKESVAIDFKHPAGRDLLIRLIEKADVLVENFRPGTMDRLGLGYAAMSERYPSLVYTSISGFGHTGPRRDEAGYDAMIQAESGLMSVTGMPDGPAVRLGVAIADISAGMFAFQGVLLALIARLRTGRGQHVDISLLDCATALLTYQAGVAFATGTAPSRLGNRHASIAPYDTYDAADGVLVLAVGNDDQWKRFCAAAGLAACADDARFTTNASRVLNYTVLRPLVADAIARESVATWTERLRAAGVPCGAVRSVTDALRDPQIIARAMVEVLPHATIGAVESLGLPVKLSDTPGAVHTAPPRLGEHTGRVLNELLHLSRIEYRALVDAGVLRPLVPPT